MRDVRSGAVASSDAIRRFLDDGAEHALSIGSAPRITASDGARVQAQFTLALSRYNAGGIRERRVSIVQLRAERRGDDVLLLSADFGPLARP